MLRREDCLIRPLEESDLDQVLLWRNSDAIRDVMFSDHLITPEEHRAWYRRLATSPTDLCLIFEYCKTPLGTVSFNKMDDTRSSCFWGFYLARTATSGVGKAMALLGLEVGFSRLQVERIFADTFAFNSRALRFQENLGFQKTNNELHQIKQGKTELVIRLVLQKARWQMYSMNLAKELWSHAHV